MTTATWLVLLAVTTSTAGYIGYLAGREGAESRCAATIADLRVALRKATERTGR